MIVDDTLFMRRLRKAPIYGRITDRKIIRT